MLIEAKEAVSMGRDAFGETVYDGQGHGFPGNVGSKATQNRSRARFVRLEPSLSAPQSDVAGREHGEAYGCRQGVGEGPNGSRSVLISVPITQARSRLILVSKYRPASFIE